MKTAKDGSDAIAQIGNESFDIVITDIKMPDIGGMELLIRCAGQIRMYACYL